MRADTFWQPDINSCQLSATIPRCRGIRAIQWLPVFAVDALWCLCLNASQWEKCLFFRNIFVDSVESRCCHWIWRCGWHWKRNAVNIVFFFLFGQFSPFAAVQIVAADDFRRRKQSQQKRYSLYRVGTSCVLFVRYECCLMALTHLVLFENVHLSWSWWALLKMNFSWVERYWATLLRLQQLNRQLE